MDEQTKKKRGRLVTIISILVMAAMVAYIVYCGLVLKRMTSAYRVVVAVGIILFWLLQQVIDPIVTGAFEGKTEKQMRAYKSQALMTLIGYLGLVFFAVSFNQNYGFYGAIVYVICIMYKRRFNDEFLGITNVSDEDTDEDADADQDGETDAAAAGDSSEENTSGVLQMDASSRKERLEALEKAEEEAKAKAQDDGPKDIRSRVARLNELADQIEESDEL